ncbi:MAG TPA: acetylxylan esterase [Blastocatellia bacterium]|nr:acetylxylan esterase [Blastocatellia bacterium]
MNRGRRKRAGVLLGLLIGGTAIALVPPPAPTVAQPAPRTVRPSDADIDAIWDLAAIKDATTLNTEVVAPPSHVTVNGVRLKVFQVMFDSYPDPEAPVRVHGFVALPVNAEPRSLPAVVFGHGAGGQADEQLTRTLAALLSAAVISFSGPGQGRSTGRPSTAENWLRTNPIQQSWLYQYAYSAMRAVTYLTTLTEVDPNRIAMTGVSAGGLMTWIANGVDDRLVAACPIMATGDWPRALASGSWFIHFPLGEARVAPDSPQALAFARYLDPLQYAHRQNAPVMLINGAQDEFFPIDTTRSTFEAVEAPDKRLEVIFDWDHGYFATTSILLGTYNNTHRALERMFGDLAAWFAAHWGTGKPLPPLPEVQMNQTQFGTTFVIPAETAPGASRALLIYSTDRAYTFRRIPMSRQRDGSFVVTLVGMLDWSTVVYFVEVQYPNSVFLTSVPVIPTGFVPRLRPYPQ